MGVMDGAEFSGDGGTKVLNEESLLRMIMEMREKFGDQKIVLKPRYWCFDQPTNIEWTEVNDPNIWDD